jgi:predicted metalloprotease with PDZ domain
MRNAISRFTSSFAALLTDRSTVIDADGRTENIRTAMLRALSGAGVNPTEGSSSKTWTDVMRASDGQTLWYLRSDVLILLSDCHGEVVARNTLDGITEMFRGLVHKNQMPGPSRMGRS